MSSQWGEEVMKRFTEVEDHSLCTLFTECLDDYITDESPGAIWN